MPEKMKIYQSKSRLAKNFDVSRSTIYRLEEEIKDQIELGRYNRYAIVDNQINVGVFVDYLKYRKLLKGKNTRKYVPPFNLKEALDSIIIEDDVYKIEREAV